MSETKEPRDPLQQAEDLAAEAGEKLREATTGAWKFLKRESIRGKRKIDKAMAIKAIEMDMSKRQRERERLFMEVGSQVYSLYKADQVRNPDLLALCEKAKELFAQDDAARIEIEQIKAEPEEAEAEAPAAEEASVEESPAATEPPAASGGGEGI
jgi:hypothetical protein